MKVKLISSVALTLGLVASSLAPAAAATPVTYSGKNVFQGSQNGVTVVFIDGTPGTPSVVDLGTQPRTYSRVAGACGEVKISAPKGNTNFSNLKVDGAAIDYATLPTQTLPACANGAFAEARTTNFKTAKGQVVIVGKTPNTPVSIVVDSELKRSVGINGCSYGVLRPSKGSTLPNSFSINGTQYSLDGSVGTSIPTVPSTVGLPMCKKSASGSFSVYLPSGWTP